MPCTDGGVPYPPSREEILEAKVPKAALCAILKAMPEKAFDNYMAHIDWKEAGITQSEFMEWWRNHQQEDAERREREAERYRIATLRRAAKSKLSQAELDALTKYDDPEP